MIYRRTCKGKKSKHSLEVFISIIILFIVGNKQENEVNIFFSGCTDYFQVFYYLHFSAYGKICHNIVM